MLLLLVLLLDVVICVDVVDGYGILVVTYCVAVGYDVAVWAVVLVGVVDVRCCCVNCVNVVVRFVGMYVVCDVYVFVAVDVGCVIAIVAAVAVDGYYVVGYLACQCQ